MMLHTLIHSVTARQAYTMFDVNNDGMIEYHEFSSALAKLDLGLSDRQVSSVAGFTACCFPPCSHASCADV